MESVRVLFSDGIYAPSGTAGQPTYDSLIGIANHDSVPHQALIHAIDSSGNEVQGSPQSFTLAALDSIAQTFLLGNGEPDRIVPFDGHMEIEFPDGVELPTDVAISGRGPNVLGQIPINWNSWSPKLQTLMTKYQRAGLGKRFCFGYCIPYYLDPTMHYGPQTYDSSLKITNRGGPASLNVIYRPNRYYPNFGTEYTSQIQLAQNQQLEKQLVELFPQIQGLNNEGWLEIAVQPSALGTIPANLLACLMISSLGYGQSPVQMGWTSDPFIVA